MLAILVPGGDWGSRGRGFKSRQPDVWPMKSATSKPLLTGFLLFLDAAGELELYWSFIGRSGVIHQPLSFWGDDFPKITSAHRRGAS